VLLEMYLTFQKFSTSTANLEREYIALNLIFSIERNLICIPCCGRGFRPDLLVYVFTEADVVSMADSTTTVGDIEGELCKIERIRDILVRRESELRYM